jgi:D-amino-acid dehydrogenase
MEYQRLVWRKLTTDFRCFGSRSFKYCTERIANFETKQSHVTVGLFISAVRCNSLRMNYTRMLWWRRVTNRQYRFYVRISRGVSSFFPQTMPRLSIRACAAGKPLQAVIGAGIVGLSVAAHLQRKGFPVVVIDRVAPGQGCSYGNAGVFATEHILPLASPGLVRELPRLLMDRNSPLSIAPSYSFRMLNFFLKYVQSAHPDNVTACAAALASLAGIALESYQSLFEDQDAAVLIKRRGKLSVYETDLAFQRSAADRALQSQHDIRFEILSSDAARSLVPALGPAVRHAVLYPDAAHCTSPLLLSQALARGIHNRGGQFVRNQVTALLPTTDGSVVVGLQSGDPVIAGGAVVAAGAFSASLLEPLGLRVPLETQRGYHIEVSQPAFQLPMPVTLSERKFIATSMLHGLRLAGTVEFAGLNAEPRFARARHLLRAATAVFPQLSIETDTDTHAVWMGHRPTLPDSLPCIGPLVNWPQIVCAFGHHHLGLTLAGVTGRLVAQVAAGEETVVPLAPFAAERFLT